MSGHEEIEPHAEFAVTERSRATPVRPAIWMTGVLAWASVIALFLHVPTWAGVFFCSLTGLSFLVYVVSYSYLMLYDREALRHERLRGKSGQSPEHISLTSANVGVIGDQTQPALMETRPPVTEQAAVIRRGDT